MQILTDIDNGRNPMHLTKDRLERAATENQFMNAKIKAIEVCVGFAHVKALWRALPCDVELPKAIGRGASEDISRPCRSYSDSEREWGGAPRTGKRVGGVNIGNQRGSSGLTTVAMVRFVSLQGRRVCPSGVLVRKDDGTEGV